MTKYTCYPIRDLDQLFGFVREEFGADYFVHAKSEENPMTLRRIFMMSDLEYEAMKQADKFEQTDTITKFIYIANVLYYTKKYCPGYKVYLNKLKSGVFWDLFYEAEVAFNFLKKDFDVEFVPESGIKGDKKADLVVKDREIFVNVECKRLRNFERPGYAADIQTVIKQAITGYYQVAVVSENEKTLVNDLVQVKKTLKYNTTKDSIGDFKAGQDTHIHIRKDKQPFTPKGIQFEFAKALHIFFKEPKSTRLLNRIKNFLKKASKKYQNTEINCTFIDLNGYTIDHEDVKKFTKEVERHLANYSRTNTVVLTTHEVGHIHSNHVYCTAAVGV